MTVITIAAVIRERVIASVKSGCVAIARQESNDLPGERSDMDLVEKSNIAASGVNR